MTKIVTFLAILTSGLSASAATTAPLTAACIQHVCQQFPATESISHFFDRENTDHPQLQTYVAKYQARIEALRLQQKRNLMTALARFQPPGELEKEALALNDHDVLQFIFSHTPWNTRVQMRSGHFVVDIDPLTDSTDPEQAKVVHELFSQFLQISPLYKMSLEQGQLNIDPRIALGLNKGDDIDQKVKGIISERLASLSPALKSEYSDTLSRYSHKLDMIKKLFGDAASLNLGALDLEMAVVGGGIQITPEQMQVLHRLIIYRMKGAIGGKSNLDLEKLYDPHEWTSQCHKAFNRALHYALTPTEQDNLGKIRDEALRRARLSVGEIFGSSVTTQLEEFLRIVRIDGPMTLDDYFKYTELTMQQYEEQNSDSMTFLDAYKQIREGGDLVREVCNQWIFQPLRDQENQHAVILSSYSAKNYQMGLAIAAHEMGHAVSEGLRILSEQTHLNVDKFLKIRSCISKNYSTATQPAGEEARFPGDALWTEEDWADAFEGHSTKDLYIDSNCAFLGFRNGAYDFTPLTARESDPHSPTFYRILNVLVHRGKQNQCVQAIAMEFPKTLFEDCLMGK